MRIPTDFPQAAQASQELLPKDYWAIGLGLFGSVLGIITLIRSIQVDDVEIDIDDTKDEFHTSVRRIVVINKGNTTITLRKITVNEISVYSPEREIESRHEPYSLFTYKEPVTLKPQEAKAFDIRKTFGAIGVEVNLSTVNGQPYQRIYAPTSGLSWDFGSEIAQAVYMMIKAKGLDYNSPDATALKNLFEPIQKHVIDRCRGKKTHQDAAKVGPIPEKLAEQISHYSNGTLKTYERNGEFFLMLRGENLEAFRSFMREAKKSANGQKRGRTKQICNTIFNRLTGNASTEVRRRYSSKLPGDFYVDSEPEEEDS